MVTPYINDESLKTIMNILGLSGAMDPSEAEKFFVNQSISSYHLEGNIYEQDYYDENEFILTKYNPKTKMFDEINLSLSSFDIISNCFFICF